MCDIADLLEIQIEKEDRKTISVFEEMEVLLEGLKEKKNPDRIQYAIEQFQRNNIEFTLKNAQSGHFHCRRQSDDKLFQFWAGTGKIMGYDNVRGIHALIIYRSLCGGRSDADPADGAAGILDVLHGDL